MSSLPAKSVTGRMLWVAKVGPVGFPANIAISTPEIAGDTLFGWAERIKIEQGPGVEVKVVLGRGMTAEEEKRWQSFWPKVK